jgi:dihydrofolate reductase
MNSLPKYVVSTTLKKVGCNNSKIIRWNVAEAISKLKQQPGQDILVAGSTQLIQTLANYVLIDGYQPLVYPVVLGSGKRLFENLERPANLKLIETRSFKSGVILQVYGVAGK